MELATQYISTRDAIKVQSTLTKTLRVKEKEISESLKDYIRKNGKMDNVQDRYNINISTRNKIPILNTANIATWTMEYIRQHGPVVSGKVVDLQAFIENCRKSRKYKGAEITRLIVQDKDKLKLRRETKADAKEKRSKKPKNPIDDDEEGGDGGGTDDVGDQDGGGGDDDQQQCDDDGGHDGHDGGGGRYTQFTSSRTDPTSLRETSKMISLV